VWTGVDEWVYERWTRYLNGNDGDAAGGTIASLRFFALYLCESCLHHSSLQMPASSTSLDYRNHV
jgi:hypothetical protein